MHVPTKTIALLTFVLLTVPAAQSTWRAAGDSEPSTPYDSPSFMFGDAPTSGGRIYFNAITAVSPGGVASVSPNVAALDTRIESPTNEYHQAMLGVWVDCNGDGYVGLAEQAAREYAAELLLDDSICPLVTGAPGAWTEGAHNYNGWVSELVPIGRVPDAQSDERIYIDNEAMVWGDYGRPDQSASFQSCFLINLPRGTLQSTGGMINYAECRFEQIGVDGLGTFNDAMDLIGDPLGLKASDPDEEDWRTSGLDVANPLGSEDTAGSPATVWDCNADPAVSEPTTGIIVPAISPQVGNTESPALAGFVNHTLEGALWSLDGDDEDDTDYDCDTTNDPGHDTYGLSCFGGGGGACLGEDDVNSVSKKNKKESDWNLEFFQEARGTAPLGPALGSGDGGAPGTTGGLGWTGLGGTGWFSTSYYASKLGFRTIRVDLDGDDPTGSEAGLSGAWWLSFYAHVGAATTSKGFFLPGGLGFYGSPQCGGNDEGIHNGWNCDEGEWYLDPQGNPTPETIPRARPGQAYELRDADCYDGRIADGVGVQPAFYGDEPCP